MIKIEDEGFIEPVFSKNVVPICFSANNGYVSQTAIMIKSIIENASDKNNYDFIILSTDIDHTNESNVLSLVGDKKNCSIRIFDISSMIDNVQFFTDSVYTPTTYSKEAYFRLFIPFVMPKYKKVVYFDGDMVAVSDVSPLMKIDLKNYMAAATRDFCGIAACYDIGSDRKQYREEIGIKDIDSYFISSMVVLNIEMFKKSYTLDYVKNLISSRKWRQHDQDILNVLCYGKTLIVDAKWSYFEEFEYSLKYLPENLKHELFEAQKDPKVVHYAGQNKAWIDDKSPLTSHFWRYASMTPYFDVFYGKISHKNVCYKYHIFKNVFGSRIDYFYKVDDIVLCSTPQLIGRLSNLKICIEFLEIKDGEVSIDGFFETIDALGTLKMFVKLNGQGLETYNSNFYREFGCEGSIKKMRAFNVKFKLDSSKRENVVEFGLTYDDIHFVTPKYVSVEQFAPINEYHFSFYSSNGWILTKQTGNRLEFEKHSRKKVFAYNKRICRFLKKKKNPYFTKMARVRWIYYLTKPLMRKKNIWLISGTKDKVDGKIISFFEHLKTKRDVEPYFVVNQECKNINELKQVGKVILAKSKIHKFLFLHAKVIVSSVYDMNFFLPTYDRANEIRDMIANKKHIYWHDNKENLSYNIRQWYNISKFILSTKKDYDFMKNHNNGYSTEQLFLVQKKLNKKELFDSVYNEIKRI